ncbi:MAG TPA: M23 family metallopeptidase [Longimicrobiales bacterium]
MQFLKRMIACAGLVLLAAADLSAQETPGTRVTWTPERPVQGTLFRVRVAADADVSRVAGRIAGEPLHFSRDGTGWQAVAAAPLDRGTQLDLSVEVATSEKADTVRTRIPVAEGSSALEKLTVAPRFGTRPDSALRARMDRERERALAVSRASHSTPRMWQEVVKPRDTRITSTFGSGREFNGQIQSRHTGTDLAGAVGAPVRAAARGVVALVDTFYLAGRVIYIDHGEGLVTAYFHLSRHDVEAGDTVDAGQQIGLVGATGRVTGPHLHWVVRYGAISVDPMSFLAIAKP